MEENKKIEAKEKRVQERLFRVAAGVAEMEVWLKDLLRRGLLTLPEKEVSFFEKIRARMVDAQATGLGNLVRDLRDLNYHSGTAWQSDALAIIAHIYLLLEGFKRLEKLDSLSQNDLKLLLGWNVSQKEILENEANQSIKDNFLLFYQHSEILDDITVQKNWLYGITTGKFALVLYFAFRNIPIQNTLQVTTVNELSLVDVPSELPIRALIKEQGNIVEDIAFDVAALDNWASLQNAFAAMLNIYPWADEMPFVVKNLTPVFYENHFYLKDECNALLALPDDFDIAKWWNLLAISGAKSLTMFVLWKNEKIIPLGVLGKKRYVLL
jgi:hypothetical protein